MADALAEYYHDKENCYADIRLARKTFGSTATTEEEYDRMEKGLGLMILHCPEDIWDTVYATLHEATYRRMYYNFQ